MISRRRLLIGSAAAVGIIGLGWGVGRWGAEKKIISVLRRRLPFLKLDDAGLRRFAKDQTAALLNKKLPTWNRLRYHFQQATAPAIKEYARNEDHRTRVDKAEDFLVSTYLLSSDFFLNHADESRIVSYVTYYDALLPCQNPFARPAVDPSSA